MRALIPRRSLQKLSVMAISLSVIGACSILPLSVDKRATAPVLDGFGATTLVPAHANESARRLFAQGMAQAYAFNRPEAIRAFKAALAQDRSCGMCAWGVAVQMGPNINSPKRGDLREASKYVDYALRHRQGASARDLALIESLALRYGHSAARTIAPPAGEICRTSLDASEKADPLDIAYADYLRALVARFPGDPDVLTHYAEAEMVATSGDWWDRITGKPQARIGELANMIEASLKAHPEHVGLNHYMIHVVDVTAVAARAEAAADRLGKLAPKSPHLLHMPSHTYAHLGRYADATRVNQQAVAADEALFAELKQQNFTINMDWRGHNGHFQWYGALMEGRGELALDSARASAQRAKGDSEYGEYVRSLPMLTLLHLQRWEELSKEPLPTGEQGIATVLGEMARGIALVRKGEVIPATAALERLKPKVKLLQAKHAGKGYIAKMLRGLVISAEAQLGAEIALAGGRVDEALTLQMQAAEAADFADRTEPPTLAGGPRQRLGAMQLRAKRYAAAEQSYRADLALHPRNGWALSGFQKALAGQGKQAEALDVQRDLTATWALADTQARGVQ